MHKKGYRPSSNQGIRSNLLISCLFYRVGTIRSPAALLAEPAHPDIVELPDGCINQLIVICKNPCLEVPFPWRLHTHSRSCQVGGADICNGTVDDDELEMNPRTQHTLHPVIEDWMPFVFLSPCSTRFLGVNQPDLHSPSEQGGYQGEEWLFIDIQVFDVSRSNPHRPLGLAICLFYWNKASILITL